MDILNRFNSQYNEYDLNLNIINKFKSCVDLYKNNIAIVDENGSLTYEEVDMLSDCLAENLISSNNKTIPDVIAIDMKRSKEYIVTMLGILKAGAAYMPIDEVYPRDRVLYMIQNADASIAITDDVNRNNLHDVIKYYNYDDMTSLKIRDHDIDISSYTNKNSNAYVMYTSGSTGTPKGIIITQKNLMSLISDAYNNIFNRCKERLNIAVVAPFVFDMSVADIYFSILMGNTLYIMPDEDKKYGEGIVKYFEKYEIDYCDITPTHLRFIADYLEECSNHYLKLKMIISIGEVLPLNLAKRIIKLAYNEHFQLLNAYGPTECTVFVTKYVLNKDNINSLEKIYIGKPISNSKIYILDKNKNICDVGCEGEIYISGSCVGNGYINRKDLTDKSFVKDILDEDKIMYATGDIGKWTKDGNIEYIGRRDNQIKLQGHRIELEEIQNRIEAYWGIKQAKVIVDKTMPGFERIVSYVLADKSINTDMILKDLQKVLPDYMIPKYILRLDKFPLNNNGKVDNKKLLTYKPKIHKNIINENYDDIERKVIEVCCDVLVKYNIKLEDNFFSLGGQSIDLLMVILQLNKYFNVNISIAYFYKSSNIKGFAEHIRNLKNKPYSKKIISEKEENTHVLVSQSQKVILEKEVKLLKNNVINTEQKGITLIYVVNINKHLNYDSLKQALISVIKKHSILRTIFKRERNKFYMYEQNENIIEDLCFTQHIHINENFNSDTEIDYKKYLKSLYMDKLPLIQVCLLEFKNKQQLILNIHHGIIDFVSIGILLKEIFTAYEENKLDVVQLTYFDYLKRNKSINKDTSLDFWKTVIKNRGETTSIASDINSSEESFTYKIIQIPDYIEADIKNAVGMFKVSEYNILLAAFGILISKYTCKKDIMIGTYIPGRDYSYDSETIGMFTSSVPVRMMFDDTYTIKDYIVSLNEYIVKVFSNQNIDLWEIYKTMSFNEVMKGELFEIFFNYEIMLKNYPCYKDYRISMDTINLDPDITEKDIYVGIINGLNNYRIEFKYNSGKHSEKQMSQFINTYFKILDVISKNSSIKIKEIVEEF